ncbi:MAG: ABC transporter permease [Ruminococcus sp.]|nr:ABC transporter permease [Ruminococcus sp.]
MSKMLFKNMLRDIGRTKARFISIMLIIMLGVGFLVGVNSTAPSMYAVVDEYYADKNLMDFRLISTVGFSEEDVKAVENTEGVEDVMPSYFCDVLTKGDTGSVIRLHAIPKKFGDYKEINSLTLKEGRMPQAPNETVIGASRFGDYELGDTISFFSPTEDADLSQMLSVTEFKIVGVVDSPLYISFERGSTNVGSGKVSAYMMIPMESFCADRYTDLYVTFGELRGLEPYSEEYSDLRDKLGERLELTSDTRVQTFVREEVESAQASIDEAKATLQSERSKAEKGFAEAQDELDAGRKALQEETSSAQKTLAAAKEKIDAGALELHSGKEEFAAEIAKAQQDIENTEAQLKKGEEEISNAKKDMKEGILSVAQKFGISREQIEAFYGEKDMLSAEDVESVAAYARIYKVSVEAQLKEAEEDLDLLLAQLKAQGIDPAENPKYISALELRDALSEKLFALLDFIDNGASQLLLAVETIATQESTLNTAKAQLSEATAALDAEIQQAEKKFAQAEAELESAWEEYTLGVKALETNQKEAEALLEKAQQEIDSKSAEAESEFEKAEEELKKAQQELDSIPEPQWLCNTRDSSPGYSSYEDDVERVTAVGKVFPIFFLLVAVLVCVTTMTRLIEEQRSDLGAFTTLGYRKSSITAKYIAYCISATVVGSAVGILLGIFSIPFVIFNAYRMLYSSLPKLVLTVDAGSAVIAIVVAMLCTSGVAYLTCRSLLRKEPATLLRPKAPKPGKRIFLEHVGFIWSRLGFFSKVTVRNIFRYKVRFFMTVLGVAGCTALIVAAFGLYGSINDVIDKQFGKVFTYDAVAAVDSDTSEAEFKEHFMSDSRIDSAVRCRQTLVAVNSTERGYYDDTYICVPENMQEFEKMVHLQQRKGGDKIEIGTKGVVLSEKLARNMGVWVGDKVSVVEKGVKVRPEVVGICENYLYGYVYMSPELYAEYFGEAPEYNVVMFTKAEDADILSDAMAEEFLAKDFVRGISFVEDSIKAFSEMIGSLNYVVLVMLVCAGALAFVVLYNLTNINIAERKREISTLKVLGFKDTETSAYIYRENLLLSLLGTGAGLVLGVWLLRFIISTVEIDMLMFGREIHFTVFIISAVLTLVFAAIVNIIMHFRIKKIDMVESMKSVE